ncbi:MAG: aldehyde ferredoxin oxidoreductase C-terminal domain-containing protein [Armatimonadota bacterium]|nr:aldehyde ferredoxin oxidoreductase C-terminal domain-containing protein [Armatimonadota bacterium]
MAKLLRVNMTDLKATYEEVPEVYRYWGGRGLTSMITSREVPPTCHPLGPSNKLVIAPGIVSGTAAPTSGRTSFGGKSPLTGTIKETNAGGLSSQKIARLGIKAIVIEGQPKDPTKYWVLKITKDGTEFLPADDLVGKGMYEVCQRLWEKHGKVAVIGIGPAGEMRMTAAGICVNDQENTAGRYAGRGGMGAVMGSKGIKAIVIDDTGGPGVEIVNKELFERGIKKLTDASLKHDVTKKGGALNTYGTNVLANIMNEAGGYPTRNFSSGRFELTHKISGEAKVEIIKQRNGEGATGHPCHPGCIIQCSDRWPNPDGTFKVSVMEYESVWALGANCGIGDLDDIADLIWLCNDIGLDTIEMGGTLAVAMEGGLLSFGDAKEAKRLLDEEIRKGTPLGRILGNGAVFTGRAFGVTRVPAVKGQNMPAYEPRAVKGIGVTYATSTMGADHTAGYTIAPEILGVGGKADPFAVQKAELSRNFQASTAFIDSTGYCLFDAFAVLDIPEGLEGMVESCAGVLGTNWTVNDILPLGLQILKAERQFNEAAGFTKAHDRLPEFMTREPLPPHNTVFDVPEEVLDEVYNF